MRRFYLFIFIFISILNISKLESQELVFNEYRPDYLNNSSAIELLVVKDYLDMRGYYLKDSYNDTWNAGIRFKYTNLWKNLKAGTCIVLDFGNNSYPKYEEMRNGVIRVSVTDDDYFEYVDPELNKNYSFKDKLSIETESDLFQLLDQGKNHVHAASHGANQSTLYNNIEQPKLRYKNALQQNLSWSVYPGMDIQSYNSIYTDYVAGSERVTIGEANSVSIYSSENSKFWYELRQPHIENNDLHVEKDDDFVNISWQKLSIKDGHQDRYGYLILAGKKSVIGKYQFIGPMQGSTYRVGDKISDWVVVENVVGADKESVKIENTFETEEYVFKLVPYAFVTDESYDYDTGLGASYSNREENITTVMFNDNLTLVNIQKTSEYIINAIAVKLWVLYSYYHNTHWFRLKDNKLISKGNDEISISDPGKYYALIYNTRDKLVAASDTVFIDTASVNIYVEEVLTTQDTSIYTCNNFQKKISAEASNPNIKLTWYLNTQPKKHGMQIIANEIGNYSCRYEEGKQVLWTSPLVCMREKQVALIPTDKKLVIPNSARLVFWFKNHAKESIYLEREDFTMDAPFELTFDEEFPLVLEENDILQCQIKYFNQNPQADTTYGYLRFTDECGNERKHLVKGYNDYTSPKIYLEDNTLYFKALTKCAVDTLQLGFGTQALAGAQITAVCKDSLVSAVFENGKNTINVDDLQNPILTVINQKNNFPEGTYNSNVVLTATRNGTILFEAKIDVFLKYVDNHITVSSLIDKIYFCDNQEWQLTEILIENLGERDIALEAIQSDYIKYEIEHIELEAHSNKIVKAEVKNSNIDNLKIGFIEKECKEEYYTSISTENIFVDFDNNLKIDASDVYVTKMDYEIGFWSNTPILYDFIEFVCPDYVQFKKSEIRNDSLIAHFGINIKDAPKNIDSLYIKNTFCDEAYPLLFKIEQSDFRIVQGNELFYDAIPLQTLIEKVSFTLPAKMESCVLEDVAISNPAFVINKSIQFPMEIDNNSILEIEYSNTFSKDSAILELHFSEPYHFTERVKLYGEINDAFDIDFSVRADNQIKIETFNPVEISSVVETDFEFIEYIDTLNLLIVYNSEKYSIDPESFSFEDNYQSIEYSVSKDSILFTATKPISDNNKLEFNYEISGREYINNAVDSICTSASFNIKDIISVGKECKTLIDAKDLLSQIEESKLDGKWINISGENPVYGQSEYEIRTKIDEELEIYLVNELGKKYDLSISRNKNIYYFNVDVNKIPRGAYTIVVKAQSKVFGKRIILME